MATSPQPGMQPGMQQPGAQPGMQPGYAPMAPMPVGPPRGLIVVSLILVLVGAIIGHIALSAVPLGADRDVAILIGLVASILLDVAFVLLFLGSVNMALLQKEIDMGVRAAFVIGSALLLGFWLIASAIFV